MAQKSLDNLIRDLQKTVNSLSQKVTSLETKVNQQNILINKQTEVISRLLPKSLDNNQSVSSAVTPTYAENKALQRPVRQARLKAGAVGTASIKRPNAAAESPQHVVTDSLTCGATPPAKLKEPTTVLQVSSSPQTSVAVGISDEEDSNEDWKTVGKSSRPKNNHNRRRRVVRGSAVGDCDLQTVERVKKIHACFFKPETSEETLKTYMDKKNPCNSYEVKKMKLKHNYYASFMITVPKSKYDYFMCADNWPASTEVSEWFHRGVGRAVRPLATLALRGHTGPEANASNDE